jgi:hypothetical protein
VLEKPERPLPARMRAPNKMSTGHSIASYASFSVSSWAASTATAAPKKPTGTYTAPVVTRTIATPRITAGR